MDVLSAKNAAAASKALEGLCVWCTAMSDYQKATKIVKPKMQALEKATVEQQVAEAELAKNEKELAEVTALMARYQAELDEKNKQKQAL
jgi:dynein heavy chain, axonemal